MPNPLVLVTGATSWVGQHCIQQLLEQGYRVRSTMRSLGNKEKVAKIGEIFENRVELVEADLMGKQEDWDAAVDGCEWVFHVASPFKMSFKDGQKEFIDPAVNGTRMVMLACKKAGSVKKVVLTSSAYACQTFKNGKYRLDAGNWGDVDSEPALSASINPYAASKILAEKEAWNIWNECDPKPFELVSILPGAIFGPILDKTMRPGPQIIASLLERNIPMLANISFPICDVRDVATAHILAAKNPTANGKRFLIVSECVTMREFAQILSDEFLAQDWVVPVSVAPNWLVKLLGYFVTGVGMLSPCIGYELEPETAPMKDVLGLKPRTVQNSLLTTAYCMVENELVEKTIYYTINLDYYKSMLIK